jgi:hypothetical protein
MHPQNSVKAEIEKWEDLGDVRERMVVRNHPRTTPHHPAITCETTTSYTKLDAVTQPGSAQFIEEALLSNFYKNPPKRLTKSTIPRLSYQNLTARITHRTPLLIYKHHINTMPVHPAEEKASGSKLFPSRRLMGRELTKAPLGITDQVAKESDESTASSHPAHQVDTGATSGGSLGANAHKANPVRSPRFDKCTLQVKS